MVRVAALRRRAAPGCELRGASAARRLPDRRRWVLRGSVRPGAHRGRATEAALVATAAALGLRRRDVTLRIGEASRDKIFTAGPGTAELLDRLRALRDGPA